MRVLQYHVGLLAQHKKPVITVILYPFKTTIPKPPFEEKSGEKVLLSLDYRVLAVWEMEAQQFVDEGAVCLYTLLPAMQGANAPLLIRALREMKAALYPAAIWASPDSLQTDYAKVESNV